jgi:hypothetical protein
VIKTGALELRATNNLVAQFEKMWGGTGYDLTGGAVAEVPSQFSSAIYRED